MPCNTLQSHHDVQLGQTRVLILLRWLNRCIGAGWLGDALDASEQALYNFEMDPVHEAFLQTIEDNQDPMTGDVPPVVPRPHYWQHPGGKCNDIAWTSA